MKSNKLNNPFKWPLKQYLQFNSLALRDKVWGVVSVAVMTQFQRNIQMLGDGNGNPLQYSCLENPREGGAWWAAFYGVAQSQTRLKQLSSSSSSIKMLKSSLEGWTTMEVPYILDFAGSEYKIETSEGKEERDREIFLMFTRVRTSNSIIYTNHFKHTVVAPPCYPGKNILNWGKHEDKIKHISQRVFEIFFQSILLRLLL